MHNSFIYRTLEDDLDIASRFLKNIFSNSLNYMGKVFLQCQLPVITCRASLIVDLLVEWQLLRSAHPEAWKISVVYYVDIRKKIACSIPCYL